MKKIIYLIFVSIAFFACDESLEDTYSEYTKPGRYVGKSEIVKVEPGMNRFKITWKNSLDPILDKVMLRWTDSHGIVDTLIFSNTDTVCITEPIFTNQDYEFRINAIDIHGNISLNSTPHYARPITKDGSFYQNLMRVEKKYFYLEDNLILLLNKYDDVLPDSKITYYSGGVETEYVLTAEDFENGVLRLAQIDEDKEVSIKNVMETSMSFDVIDFDAYSLQRGQRRFSADFLVNLMVQLDKEKITNEDIDAITVLNVNYDFESFEDILYLPNLEVIKLSEGRLVNFASSAKSTDFNQLADLESSLRSLRIMREVKGIEVELYDKRHYAPLADSLEFVTVKPGNRPPFFHNVPEGYDSWNYSHNDPKYYENENPEDNYSLPLTNILSPSSFFNQMPWRSRQLATEIATHEIVMDMLTSRSINGFTFAQNTDVNDDKVRPNTIGIYISQDGETWEPAFFRPDVEVGNYKGEVTTYNLKNPKTAQYIKLVVKDIVTDYNNYVAFELFLPLI